MTDNRIDSTTRTEIDRSQWDPPPPAPRDARAERLHADAVHADRIDNLPWHPTTCDYSNFDQVAGCTNTPVLGGTLFIKGKGDVDAVDPNDIKQNRLGDCYLLSAASAMAQTPEGRQRIHDMIRERRINGKTVYEVTFREPVSQASTAEGFRSPAYREVTVQVPADKFIEGHAIVGDRSGKKQEIWPLVLEAGYAEYKKGYPNMANGGIAVDAFTAITGRAGQLSHMPAYDEAQLKRDFSAHKPMVISFGAHAPLVGPPSTTVPAYNLYAAHAYSVVNVFQKDGETYVQLRNPWGTDDPKPVPLRELQRLEAQVETT